MYKLIIAGGRDFSDYEKMKGEVRSFIVEHEIKNTPMIISGNANGADKLGERLAIEERMALQIFPADWGRYGRGAGHVRNSKMAKEANGCIVFWDGKSKGTKSMIEKATKKGLDLKVVLYS